MKASAYTPFDVSTKDRVVGFFLIGAVLLFLLGFFIPFIERISTEEGVPFYTVLDQTYGIGADAAVTLRGVRIGKVNSVGLTSDGRVRVDIVLSDLYEEFYTRNSSLAIDSRIGVSTLLTGSGLILLPGNIENGLLDPGDFISADAPRGISSILDELDILQLTSQITEIVSNVKGITSGIAENQHKLFASMDNLEKVTASLVQISAELPGVVQSIDQSLVSLQSTMKGVDHLVTATEGELIVTLKNTARLTEQARLTLEDTDKLFRATTPVMRELPTVMVATDVALQSITKLTDQMSRSWLFGGGRGSSSKVTGSALPAGHPHDNDLYELASEQILSKQ